MFGATAALESLPMIANAEAMPTSVESPASHAGFSTVNRSFLQIVLGRPARACHVSRAAFVYDTRTMQQATRNLHSATCNLQ